MDRGIVGEINGMKREGGGGRERERRKGEWEKEREQLWC
jgi:hypothetical protein